jgi:hypothetical protein
MNHRTCYYCGTNMAITEKFTKTICDECNKKEFRSIPCPDPNEPDSQKALRMKLMISAFDLAFSEKEDEIVLGLTIE